MHNPLEVALLDDDDIIRLSLTTELAAYPSDDLAFVVTSFATSDDLKKAAASKNFDVFIIDLVAADGAPTGVNLTARLRQWYPAAVVLAYSFDMRLVPLALEAGAHDFLHKDRSTDEIALRIKQAWTAAQKRGRSFEASSTIGATMRDLAVRIPGILGSAINAVHVNGETGTGKEVVAALLEARVAPAAPFVKINCAAISANLMEAELFGHARGAFTGATADRIGYLEAAAGGWIFLDEINSLAASTQAALLRAIENREIIRVGETKTRHVDFRVFSAANEPLADLVAKGRFRADLWQRLTEAVIELPPLRARLGEAQDLIEHFCRTERGGPYRMSPEAKAMLLLYDWRRGNVREMRACIRAMTERHVDKELTPNTLPLWFLKALGGEAAPEKNLVAVSEAAPMLSVARQPPRSLREYNDEFLVELVRCMKDEDPRLSLREVAEALDIPKTTLASKLARIKEGSAVLAPRLPVFT